MDTIRVLRLIEYVGPRDAVEKCVSGSINGTRIIHNGDKTFRIRIVTLGEVSEILGPLTSIDTAIASLTPKELVLAMSDQQFRWIVSKIEDEELSIADDIATE